MSYSDRAREVLAIEIEGLQQVLEDLNASFDEATALLLETLEAGGKIVITGLGKSLHVGQKMAATFTSTGTPSVVLHPSEAMHGDLGILAGGDALLALSFSGESEELLNLVPLVKRKGVKIVAVTRNADNTLANFSDAVIAVPVQREACPFNMAPTSSTTATLAVGDALAMVLLEARGFQKDDYAKLHPGGAIGRTLLSRVSDIMRTGDRLARVPADATVKDAILAMTRARSGAVAVVDEEARVLGVFTDGDLRRTIAEGENPAHQRVDAVMTPHPITLRDTSLAVDVLALYEQHNIDDLLVVDQDGRLTGIVDIQDLPKLKIL